MGRRARGKSPRVDEVRSTVVFDDRAVRDETAHDERVHADDAVSGRGRCRRAERDREGERRIQRWRFVAMRTIVP
jgi:hypothetical protein